MTIRYCGRGKKKLLVDLNCIQPKICINLYLLIHKMVGLG